MAAKDREPVQLWSNQLPTISQHTTMEFFARRTIGLAQDAEIPDLMKFWRSELTGPTIFANSAYTYIFLNRKFKFWFKDGHNLYTKNKVGAQIFF